MQKIILASASPRRKQILEYAGIDFTAVEAHVKEEAPSGDLEKTVINNALLKAREVYSRTGGVVLGADTLVGIDGIYLGKPGNEKEAFEMLKRLSGRENTVFTGVAVVSDKGEKTDCCITKVKFYELSDEEIIEYIKTGDPLDKAGSYGLLGRGCFLCESIQGDFFSVIGLPVGMVIRMLRE